MVVARLTAVRCGLFVNFVRVLSEVGHLLLALVVGRRRHLLGAAPEVSRRFLPSWLGHPPHTQGRAWWDRRISRIRQLNNFENGPNELLSVASCKLRAIQAGARHVALQGHIVTVPRLDAPKQNCPRGQVSRH